MNTCVGFPARCASAACLGRSPKVAAQNICERKISDRHRMLCSCTHVETEAVEGLKIQTTGRENNPDKANNAKHSKTKLPGFSHLLWHSAMKWGGFPSPDGTLYAMMVCRLYRIRLSDIIRGLPFKTISMTRTCVAATPASDWMNHRLWLMLLAAKW